MGGAIGSAFCLSAYPRQPLYRDIFRKTKSLGLESCEAEGLQRSRITRGYEVRHESACFRAQHHADGIMTRCHAQAVPSGDRPDYRHVVGRSWPYPRSGLNKYRIPQDRQNGRRVRKDGGDRIDGYLLIELALVSSRPYQDGAVGLRNVGPHEAVDEYFGQESGFSDE